MSEPSAAPRRYRTLWVSDVHLGTRDAKAEYLLDFLRATESDTLYLLGDVVDGWALRRSWYWTQAANDVVQKVLRKARKGTRVVYVPGNHDSFARAYVGHSFGGIDVRERALHTTADGRRLLVLHGDEFDGVVRLAPWLSHVGAWAYQGILRLNRPVNRLRARLGRPYWSLSAYLKGKAKRAVQYVGDFGVAVAAEAARHGADGVVCGHIHHAEIREVGGVQYLNCGDWVESCTALAEGFDGRLELVRWHTVGHDAGRESAGRDGAVPTGDGRAYGTARLDLPGDGAPTPVPEVRVPEPRVPDVADLLLTPGD